MRDYKPICGCQRLKLPTGGLNTAASPQDKRFRTAPGTHLSSSLRAIFLGVNPSRPLAGTNANGLSVQTREGAPSEWQCET
jgi:hypothetical protein